MASKFARPVHPGEFLREEYLVPLGMSAGALAKKLNLPRTRIERIAKEEIGLPIPLFASPDFSTPRPNSG